MILAPLLSWRDGPLREQVLVCVDAASYGLLAVAAVKVSPSAVGSLAFFLCVSTTLASWRHVATWRSRCHRDDTPEGTMRAPPIVLEDATPAPASVADYLFVGLMWTALGWLLSLPGGSGATPPSGAVGLLLLGAWGHFWRGRGHGDHNGGKHVPTVFAIMLHLAAAMAGAPPDVTLSLHRIMILLTYWFTGFRKVFCTGFRWADGINLQFMLGIQGLYHDIDYENGLPLNTMLAGHRWLCKCGSIAVLGLQLLMPAFVLWPGRGALVVAFWLAMSFHAGNHFLWRINFFGSWCPALVALLVPIDQIDPATLWRSICRDATALVPALCVVAAYCIMQLGHALDRASEKLAAEARARVLASTPEGGILRWILLVSVNAFEFHLLGDYYTSYWPEQHRHDIAVACIVVRWRDGGEMLLPASGDYYFRRHINAWIAWPRAPPTGRGKGKGKGAIDATSCWIAPGDTPGGSAVGSGGRLAEGAMPVDEVIRRIASHLEASFVAPGTLDRIKRSGGSFRVRVRGVRYDGTALRAVRLWERGIQLGE